MELGTLRHLDADLLETGRAEQGWERRAEIEIAPVEMHGFAEPRDPLLVGTGNGDR